MRPRAVTGALLALFVLIVLPLAHAAGGKGQRIEIRSLPSLPLPAAAVPSPRMPVSVHGAPALRGALVAQDLSAELLSEGGRTAPAETSHDSAAQVFAGNARISHDEGFIGLIGVGRQGLRHLKTLVAHGAAVRGADRHLDDKVRAEYPESPSVKLERADASGVLSDPSVRGVIIATPGKTHYEVVKQALEAGKHVLVEKPFTQTTAQAEELVALAAKRNLILMVGHNRYYLPHFQRLKAMVESGKLGAILSVEGNYLNPPQKNDRTHTALEGLGYHQFYMINAVLNQEHPTKVVGVVASEDRETVGVKLLYGDVPVTVKLDRNFSGPKTRTLVVVGSEFTAVFDYAGEPATTRLHIRPTNQATPGEPRPYDNAALTDLKSQEALLTAQDAQPSLDHQLRAFRLALATGLAPPSDGRSAISVVETLEEIRRALGASNLYYHDPLVSSSLVADVARRIRERIGDKGGVVAVDGIAGVGKSTLVQALADVYELLYPTNRSVVNALDELLLPVQTRVSLKKHILRQPLQADDLNVLERFGWRGIEPGEPFNDEERLWRNDLIEAELALIRGVFDLPAPLSHLTITRPDAYIKRQALRLHMTRRYNYHPGDVVFLDGKTSNREGFAKYTDYRIRLRDSVAAVRQRFMRERETILTPDELAQHMAYYDLVIAPSWNAYQERTRGHVDLEIDLQRGDPASQR